MPIVEVPLQSWKEVAGLRKSKKFRRLGDEALALSKLAKIIKARREELSLELYDPLEETLPDQIKTVRYDGAKIDRQMLIDIVRQLLPENLFIASGTMTKKVGGETKKLNQKQLMATPIPCSNPKCKADNYVTADIIELCTKKGTSRAGVSIKLDDGDSDEE